MPERKERDRWWAFINGRPELEWNLLKTPKKPRGITPRQFADDMAQYEVPMTELSTGAAEAGEVLVVNEFDEVVEVQVDQNQILDRSEGNQGEDVTLLPTPLSTPRPEERFRMSDRRNGEPRHPTPILLKAMDSVSVYPCSMIQATHSDASPLSFSDIACIF